MHLLRLPDLVTSDPAARAADRVQNRAYRRLSKEAWEAAGLPLDPGQDRVVPYIFPHPGLTSAPGEPAATWARTGMYCFDTMTLIGPGTWEAARAARELRLAWKAFSAPAGLEDVETALRLNPSTRRELKNTGEVDAALLGAAKRMTRSYSWPY